MDTKLLTKFCETLKTEYLDQLSQVAQVLIIDGAYSCLHQKYGNQEAAEIILIHFNEIIKVDEYIVYKGDYEISGYQAFKRYGVITVPVVPVDEIEDYREQFKDTLRGFPEYSRHPTNIDKDSSNHELVYVLGGFAALGNPSSFHNKFARNLRLRAKEAVKPLFKEFIDRIHDNEVKNDSKLEMLIDRMMYRFQSQKPSSESWHRDVVPEQRLNDSDEVFGGWINLDTKDQYFSCIPGSHLGIAPKKLRSGFAAVPKSKIKIVGKHKKKFKCPPGHVIIFPQYILHEVLAGTAKYTMMRLFTGWRITTANTSMHPNMMDLLRKQAIIPLGSGDKPAMYAANHGSFFLRKQFKPVSNMPHKVNLIEWSKNTFKPETMVNKTGGDGRKYTIVNRFLESLDDYGFPKYPEYSKEEADEYLPQKLN